MATANQRDKNLRFKNGSWFAYKKVGGRAVEKRLDTADKMVARGRRDVWVKDLIAAKHREVPIPTFEEAAQRFAYDHFVDLKPSSVARYSWSLLNMLPVFRHLPVDRIGHAELKAYERSRSDVTGSTILRDFACLSVMFTRFAEWGIKVDNPVKVYLRIRKRSKALVENPARTRYLTQEDEMALLAQLGPRRQDIVAVAIDTGLRRSELFKLEWAQVDLVRGRLTVLAANAKSGKARSIPLWPRSLSILRAIYRNTSGSLVFTTEAGKAFADNSTIITETLDRAAERAGIAPLSFHDLRRTCGCRLLQVHRFQMSYVSHWLGHSSVKVTEKHYAFLGVEQLEQLARESLERTAAQEELGLASGRVASAVLQSDGQMMAGLIIEHQKDPKTLA